MRHPALLLLLPALLLPLAGCDRRKDDVHRGVEWASQQFAMVNGKARIGAMSLVNTIENGGDPVTWLNANLSARTSLPCCDREPHPWRVSVTWTPQGLVTVSGYGANPRTPIEETKVQLDFAISAVPRDGHPL